MKIEIVETKTVPPSPKKYILECSELEFKLITGCMKKTNFVEASKSLGCDVEPLYDAYEVVCNALNPRQKS